MKDPSRKELKTGPLAYLFKRNAFPIQDDDLIETAAEDERGFPHSLPTTDYDTSYEPTKSEIVPNTSHETTRDGDVTSTRINGQESKRPSISTFLENDLNTIDELEIPYAINETSPIEENTDGEVEKILRSLLDDVVQSNKEIRFLERFLTRKHATRGFFELLELHSRGIVVLEQSEMYCEIYIRPGPYFQ